MPRKYITQITCFKPYILMNKSNGFRVNGTFFEIEVTISKEIVYWYFIIGDFF